MSGTSKPDLARVGTMQRTAEEGAEPYLNDTEVDSEGDEDEDNDTVEEGEGDGDEETVDDDDTDGDEEIEADEDEETPRLSKYNTMKETAEEGEEYLKDQGRPDEDAATRGQQRKLDEIYAEEPSSKVPRLAKASTMTETVVAGKAFIARRRRRLTELCQVKKEAEALYGKMRMTEGIWMRKRMARTKMAKLNQEETLVEPVPVAQSLKVKAQAEKEKAQAEKAKASLIKKLEVMKRLKMKIRHASRKSPQRAMMSARGRHLSKAACSRSRTKSRHLSKSARVSCRSRTYNKRSMSRLARTRSRSKSPSRRSPARRSPGRRSPARRLASSSKRATSPPRRASPGKRSVSPGKRRKLRGDRSKSGTRKMQKVQSRSAKTRAYHKK